MAAIDLVAGVEKSNIAEGIAKIERHPHDYQVALHEEVGTATLAL